MTLTLELTAAQESEVRARAAERAPESDAYLAALMRYALDVYTLEECDPVPAPGESAADGVEDLIGVIHSAELAALSENPGESFADALTARHRQGKF